MEKLLPSIPAKRYFTISEVSNLCGVKPHVLRYWEQEFTQLRPMKRRGNRRYYQHHEVLMIRKIRELLYEQGFTIIGARNKLQELVQIESVKRHDDDAMSQGMEPDKRNNFLLEDFSNPADFENSSSENVDESTIGTPQQRLQLMRRELLEIRDLLSLSC